MTEVSKEEYYNYFADKDAVVTLVGNYPYTAIWKLRSTGVTIAKSVEEFVSGSKYYTVKKYFINK